MNSKTEGSISNSEMDYHSMNRRELQELCKQYQIPANSTNSVMADKLSQLLNDKKKPTTRQQRTCLKSSSETVEETDVTIRQAKKVRFSPKNEEFEYELRSGQKRKANVPETKPRRKSVAKKIDEPVADNVDIVKSINEGGEISVRATRSSGQALGKGVVVPNNGKKHGRKAMKDVKKESEIVKGVEVVPVRVTRSKVETLGKSVVLVDKNNRRRKTGKDVENDREAVKEIEDRQIRVTRSKGMDPDLNLQVKNGSSGVAKDVVHVEPSKRIVDDPIRVTRARAQTLKNDLHTVAHPAAEKRRAGKELKVAGRSNESSVMSVDAAPGDIQALPKRKSLRNREVVIDDGNDSENLKPGRRTKGSNRSIEEVSENEKPADKGRRRSSRNEKNVEESTVLNKNVRKVKVVSDVKVTRSRSQFLVKSAERNNKTKRRNEVGGQRDSDMVHQVLEHVDKRNGNRRKSAMPKPEDSEVVLQLEEPTNRPARRGGPRNSVVLKGEEQGVDKPMVGKGKMLKESEMVELARVPSRRSQCHSDLLQPIAPTLGNGRSNKTIGRKRSKEQSGDHRSKKLRGEPIVEEPSETKYAASVESPRRFTRSASRNEGKAVTNSPQKFAGEVQQPSSSKTRNSMTGNQSAPENASVRRQQSGTVRALRSGVIRGSSSKKRAKLRMSPRETQRTGSEKGRSRKSNIKGAKGRLSVSSVETSASRFRSSETDERVAETEYSPIVKETPRRFTRSAIKSERNAVGTLFEKVDEKQQQSQSAVKWKPTENAQLSSHEVADDRPDADSSRVIKHSSSKKRKKSTSTEEIHSKTSDEAMGETFVKSVAVSEANDVVEVNQISISETAIVKENMNSGGQSASRVELTEVSDGSCATASAPTKSRTRIPTGEGMEIKSDSVGKSSRRFTRGAAKCERTVAPNLPENVVNENQESVVNLPNYEVDIPSGVDKSEIEGTPTSVADAPETATGELLDRSHLKKQNEEVSVKSAIPNEAEVPGNTEATPVFKPVEPEAYEKDIGMETSGSTPVGLHITEEDKEPEVSTGETGAAAGNGNEGIAEANNVDENRGSMVNLPNYEVDIPSAVDKSEIEGIPASVADTPETATDELLDRSHLKKQNEEVSVKSAILNVAEVPAAVNTEVTPVFKPVEPEAYEKDIGMETSGSTPVGLHITEEDKEPEVSTGETGAAAGNGNEGIAEANNMDENRGSMVNLPNYEVDIPSAADKSEIEGIPASVADAPETATDEYLDRSHLKKQNEEVSVKSAILNEAEVPAAVNTEVTPVFKPVEPEAYEKDIGMETSGSTPVGLHINEGDNEPEVSTGETGAAAGNGNEGIAEANNMDAGSKFDAVLYRTDSSADGHASIEQLNLMTKLHAMESPLELPSSEKVPDAPSIVVESKQEQSTSKGTLRNPSVGEHDVVDDGQRVAEDDRADTKEMMGEPDVNNDRISTDTVILRCPDLGENDVADGVDHQELDSEQPSSNKDTSQNPAVGEHSVELNGVKTEKELVSKLGPSTGNDIFQGPALCENNFKTDEVNAQEIKVDKVSTGEDILPGLALDTHDFVDNVVDVEKDMKPEQEPSTTKDKLQDNSVSEPEPEPSFSNDICQRPALCKNVVEVESVGAQKCGESEVEQSTAQDFGCSSAMDEYVGDYAQKEAEYEPLPSTGSKELEVPAIDKIDVAEKLDCESVPSTGATVLESVFGCNDVDNKDADARKELESESKPPTGSDMLGTPTLEKLSDQDEGIVAHSEFEQVPSAVNDVPALRKNDVEVESVDAQKEVECEPVLPTCSKEIQVSAMDEIDVFNANQELDCDSVPSTGANVLEPVFGSDDVDNEGADANKELESECKPPTDTNMLETPNLGKIDVEDRRIDAHSESEQLPSTGFNVNQELDCDSVPSTGANVLEPVFGSDDVDNEGADANKELESECKPPTDTNMLETPNLGKIDVEDRRIDAHSESEQLPSTGNNGPAVIDDSEDRVNAQNEYNMPVVLEYPNKLSDQEPEAVLHVADGEVPKAATDGCASIAESGPLPGCQVLETSAEGGNDVSSEGLDTHEESIQSSKKDSISQNSDHGKREELVNRVCDGSVSGTISGSDDLLPIYNSDEIEVLVDTKNDISFCENDAASNYGIASATESGTVRGEKSIDESEEFFNLSEDSSIKALFETQWVHEPLGVSDFQESQETKEGRLGLVDDPGKEGTSLVADDVGRNMGEFVDQYFDNKDEPDSNLVPKDDQIKKNKQESLLTEVGGGPSETISNLGDVDTDRGTVEKDSSGPEQSTDDEPSNPDPVFTADEPSNPEPVKNRTQDAKEASSSCDEDDKDDYSQEDDQPREIDTDVKMVDATSGKETQTGITPGCRTLFMGNLSYAIYEEDVRDFFKEAGEIAEIRFAIKDDMFRGYGYIEFTTAEAAQEALKLNRKLLLERPIRLELANERGVYNPGGGGEQAQRRSVFIQGFDVNDSVDSIQGSLIECFKNCGEISRCHVPTDYHSGAPRGVAFIDFADSNAFNRALELNGSELGPNKITVKEARGPRRDNNNRGSWRGGGRGFDGGRGGGRGGGSHGGFYHGDTWY